VAGPAVNRDRRAERATPGDVPVGRGSKSRVWPSGIIRNDGGIMVRSATGRRHKEQQMTQPLPFQDQVAVVTGSARGIGRVIAETLASRGANILIADVRAELAEATAHEVAQASGRQVVATAVDVANAESAKAMIETAIAQLGRVDVLVNNAGITRDNLIMRIDDNDWDMVLNINLKGAFNCSKAVIRPMMKQRYGRIVNIASVSGLAGQAGQTNYSSSKAGLVGFTKALAREVGSRNITVNAVAPGLIPTDLTKDLPDDLKTASVTMIPLGRWGTPQEVANAVAFLASGEANYITGHVLSVDGGMFMM
jgi:3-oxoacyl-[acyl-carrier protein] reductase